MGLDVILLLLFGFNAALFPNLLHYCDAELYHVVTKIQKPNPWVNPLIGCNDSEPVAFDGKSGWQMSKQFSVDFHRCQRRAGKRQGSGFENFCGSRWQPSLEKQSRAATGECHPIHSGQNAHFEQPIAQVSLRKQSKLSAIKTAIAY